MKTILFLCTGNSCRSILAEVLLNYLSEGCYVAYSAGSFPIGRINPDSLNILQKHGLPTENLKSKSWNGFVGIEFDIVITVCDNAEGEVCPLYLNKAIKAHWGIADPDKIVGKNRAVAFEKSFRQMKNRIKEMLALKVITSENLNYIGKHTK